MSADELLRLINIRMQKIKKMPKPVYWFGKDDYFGNRRRNINL